MIPPVSMLLMLRAVFAEAVDVHRPTNTKALANAATISERALLPKRSSLPPIGGTTAQVCGYITGDVFNPLACADGQFCHSFPGYLGCCNTAIPFNSTYTTSEAYIETLSLTASDTTTILYVQSGTQTYYSYHDCEYVTTCYDLQSISTSSLCTGACLSNSKNLIW